MTQQENNTYRCTLIDVDKDYSTYIGHKESNDISKLLDWYFSYIKKEKKKEIEFLAEKYDPNTGKWEIADEFFDYYYENKKRFIKGTVQ